MSYLTNMCQTDDLIALYELERCTVWITENSFSRVCLQFPDELLKDAADVALYLDARIGSKTYILGDTSFFSCCVDEIGSKHVDGDAVIHFGYSCLSNFTNLPVLYVLIKKQLDLNRLLKEITPIVSKGPSLIVYDSCYAHLSGRIGDRLQSYQVSVAQFIADSKSSKLCGPWCQGPDGHSSQKFGLSFCVPSELSSIVFVGNGKRANHFMMSMKAPEFYTYDESKGLQSHSFMQIIKKLSFLVEKVKNARTFGILIGTVSVERYLDAIDHVKQLLKRRRRKCFIISVGKPTVAKLSNFPDIDAFIIISCNEGHYIENKELIVPIVTLLEVELVFNENRSWDDPLSADFAHFLPGSDGYIETPDTEPEDSFDAPLTSSFLSNAYCSDSSKELAIRSDMIVATSAFSSKTRTWDGLELNLNDVEPALAVPGRIGTSQGYGTEFEQNK